MTQHDIQMDVGLHDESLKSLRRGLVLCEQILQQNPDDAGIEGLRGLLLTHEGHNHAARQQFEKALEAFTAARAIMESQIQSSPGQPQLLSRLSSVWQSIAFMKRQQLDREGAETAWGKSIDLQQRAAHLSPEVASLHSQLAAQYRWRAASRRDFGDLDGALSDLRHVRELHSGDTYKFFLTAAIRASFVFWIDRQEW